MIEWPFDPSFDLLSAVKESKPLKTGHINVNSSEIQILAQWFTTVPRYTSVRVNTVNTNIQQVIEVIKNQLSKHLIDGHTSTIPCIIQDDILKDCIIVYPKEINTDLQHINLKHYFEVIVDVLCGVSVLRGANIFAPGVIGMTPAVKEGDVVSVFADVSGKCLRGFMKPYDDPRKKFLGRGVAKMTRSSLFEVNNHPTGIAIEMIETISGVPSFVCPPDLGLLQNYPSILCSHVLDPQKGDLILDMCASPGNKTTHIASILNGKGHIIALDKTEKKVNRIRESCNIQKLNNVTACVCNAITAVDNNVNAAERDVFKGPPFNKNTFDRVLLDAPCSALGQRPQLNYSVPLKHLNSFPNLQKQLFKSAVNLLKPSGTLVYSTCTLLVAENEGIVSWALREFPELQLVPAEPIIGSPGNINCGLTPQQCNCVQKFGPYQSKTSLPYQNETIGFFIAKFTKLKNR